MIVGLLFVVIGVASILWSRSVLPRQLRRVRARSPREWQTRQDRVMGDKRTQRILLLPAALEALLVGVGVLLVVAEH